MSTVEIGGEPAFASDQALKKHYQDYIRTINLYSAQLASSTAEHRSQSKDDDDRSESNDNRPLDRFLSHNPVHNDKTLSKEGYHALILPGSVFHIERLVGDAKESSIGARLKIEIRDWDGEEEEGDGRWRMSMKEVKENVFYELDQMGRIVQVWSMVEGL